MTDKIRAGTLRGIVMRAPGITATRDFYLEQWGLHLAHEEDGITYLRGTGSEPFIYGLKDGATYGIEYIHFGMKDRAEMDALYAQITAQGQTALSAPAVFADAIGGYGFDQPKLQPPHVKRKGCHQQGQLESGGVQKPSDDRTIRRNPTGTRIYPVKAPVIDKIKCHSF